MIGHTYRQTNVWIGTYWDIGKYLPRGQPMRLDLSLSTFFSYLLLTQLWQKMLVKAHGQRDPKTKKKAPQTNPLCIKYFILWFKAVFNTTYF